MTQSEIDRSDLYGSLSWREQYDYDHYQIRPKERVTPKDDGGKYCFGCFAKVDHHDTGNPMQPIEVRNRGTNEQHFCLEMARFRGRRRR